MRSAIILVVEADQSLRQFLKECLSRRYFLVFSSSDKLEIMRVNRNQHPQMAIIGCSRIEIAKLREIADNIRYCGKEILLLLMARNSSEDLAIAALRAGIHEYVKYPCERDDLVSAVSRCLSKSTPEWSSERGVIPAGLMIGESKAMQEVRTWLAQVASTNSNVLITGETGTGKERAAEFVHENSSRKFHPFATINCAAIPDSLLESELFGYERGAFTGAQCSEGGKLRAAQGGTVFLDEVGDMSQYAQAKILRVIDSKEIQPIGRNGVTTVNVRIIAASNQELERLVREDKFRKDLYFRLNVARVHLPPLRERKEDLRSIVTYYLQDLNVRFGRKVHCLSGPAWDYFLAYDWPGNVRELKNLLEVIFIRTSSSEISAGELPHYLREQCEKGHSLADDERKRMLSALLSTDWNKSKAADKLRWSRMTLYRKMARYHVSRSRDE